MPASSDGSNGSTPQAPAFEARQALLHGHRMIYRTCGEGRRSS